MAFAGPEGPQKKNERPPRRKVTEKESGGGREGGRGLGEVRRGNLYEEATDESARVKKEGKLDSNNTRV